MSVLIKKGDTGNDVKGIQELLSLAGFATPIDGSFGPATQALVERYQASTSGPRRDGVVDDFTFYSLRKRVGLDMVIEPPSSLMGVSLGQTIANIAVWHSHFNPREVGGDNRGPWVRLYMDGDEGLPWCGGFVKYVIAQACKLTLQKSPIPASRSCTEIAEQAKIADIFRSGEELTAPGSLPNGSLFMTRKKGSDGKLWEHTGIVIYADPTKNIVRTVEGNTNEDGSREGYEVCIHTKQLDVRDYAIIA